MKIIKANTLFDGIDERKNYFIGFEHDEIKFVGPNKPDDAEIIAEGENIVVTSAFIDSHSHIGLVRAGEPSGEAEDCWFFLYLEANTVSLWQKCIMII